MAEYYQLNRDDISLGVAHVSGLRFSYMIRVGDATHTGDDLGGAPCGDNSLPAIMGALISFLSAFFEARDYGTPDSENWDLFPDELANDALQDFVEELHIARVVLGED